MYKMTAVIVLETVISDKQLANGCKHCNITNIPQYLSQMEQDLKEATSDTICMAEDIKQVTCTLEEVGDSDAPLSANTHVKKAQQVREE